MFIKIVRLFCAGCLLLANGLSNLRGYAPALVVQAARLVDSGSYPISITPDQMQFSGQVTTSANCSDPVVCSWLSDSPAGTILLGVNPGSAQPIDWAGGSATIQVALPDTDHPTRLVLRLSWPDQARKGLRSLYRNQMASIWLDGSLVWDKKTITPGWDGLFHATAGHELVTTLAVNGTSTHTLMIQVAPNTAWDISQITISAYPAVQEYRGIGYSPFRDCQYPGGTVLPGANDIASDLTRLAQTTNTIRTYSSVGVNALVPALANKAGLSIFPGAWLDYPKTTIAQDSAEISGLIDLACTNDVKGVIVGNEYYLRHRGSDSITYLLQRIQDVRTGIKTKCNKTVPITTAEIENLAFTWPNDSSATATGLNLDYKPILDSLDFFMVHIYPFWSGLPTTGGAAYTVNRFLSAQSILQQAYPGQNKWLIIGETGWPSGGEPNSAAVPSQANQSTYLRELLPLVDLHHINLLYFDAFDELWKYDEGGKPGTNAGYGAGQRWGYAYPDRSAKQDFYGVMIPAGEFPDLPSPAIPPNQIFLPVVGRAPDPNSTQTFTLYSEWPEGADNFVPSGWMGDLQDIGVYGCDRSDPHSGYMAYRINYTATGSLGWSGVFWQYPENNWGDSAKALDLSWANKVTFWAKGSTGSEVIRFFVGGIGTASTPYHDSLNPQATSGFVRLSSSWQKYTINLAGRDLSHLIGGFGWTADRCSNPAGAVFYLDDIRYENEPGLLPPSSHGANFNIYTDASAPGNHYFPTGMMGDAASPALFQINECWTQNTHSGPDAIRVNYTGPGWAGVYWVDPAENWGDRPGGYNLTGLKKVTFWARSDTPNLQVEIIIGGVGYGTDANGNTQCGQKIKPYPDSVCPKVSYFITPSSAWQQYTLSIPASANLANVVGGFGFVLRHPATFFLDDILYTSQ